MKQVLILLVLLGGCSTTVYPPAHPAHPVTVLIADSGRHSSILLPDPQGGMVEYAFGDYDWFALGHTDFFTLVHALVSSRQSTLTRRWIFQSFDEVNLKPTRVQPLVVEADRMKQLRDRLDYQYEIHTDRGMVYSPTAEAYAVPSDQQYNLLHNCNHVTGEWLRELGARTEGLCAFSDYRVAKAP